MHRKAIQNVARIQHAELRIFWVLSSAVGLLLASYLYLVSSSIVNVIVRGELENTIAATHSELSTLETEYLAKKNAVSLDRAFALGFHASGEKRFVAKRSLYGSALSLGNEI